MPCNILLYLIKWLFECRLQVVRFSLKIWQRVNFLSGASVEIYTIDIS